jgi:hypothetical protein
MVDETRKSERINQSCINQSRINQPHKAENQKAHEIEIKKDNLVLA